MAERVPSSRAIEERLRTLGSKEYALVAARYFKTAPGEYGEGDVFVGLRVPETRALAKEYAGLPEKTVLSLLRSKIHECRLLALIILVNRAGRGSPTERRDIYERYLAHTEYINNWDLVDTSARDIVGGFLFNRSRKPLYSLLRSSSLWERRIAIVSTHYFILRNDHVDTLAIAERLLSDPHDLMHKASGWMLREVGKKDKRALVGFLDAHARSMPRTMLRYSIEHFTPSERARYMAR